MGIPLAFSAYPPTSFPFRDLLVVHHFDVGPGDRVCEIGVGSGGTTVRLAKVCREVVGFEISKPTVAALRYLEERHPNLRFVPADITRREDTGGYEGSFTRALACDTLEHVEDPRAFFEAVARLLAPGGEMLVTFPNEPEAKMHGVTRFDTPDALASLVSGAGLEVVRFGAAKLSPWAGNVAENLGWRPLRATRALGEKVRRLRRPAATSAPAPAAPPQTFESTRFMRQMSTWKKLAPAVNLYWHGVLHLMDRNGPSFEIDDDFRATDFRDCQVFLTARKPRSASGNA